MSTIKVTNVNPPTAGQAVNINGLAYPTAGPLSNRNKIINGNMQIDQRNTSVTADNFTVDRWKYSADVASKATVAQSTTAPSGFTNSLLVTSSSAYTVPSGETYKLQQRIEGFNVADLAWGTASAKTIVLSFYVRSSLTGTFGGALRNSGSTRSYPFSYSISAADTWEQKTVTIAGDTSGTWGTGNGIGIEVNFGLGVGSTYSGTAGSWSSNNYLSATGATSVVGTNGATFYITGVQLEVGSVATPFEHRSYGDELRRCYRYYQLMTNFSNSFNAPGTSESGFFNYEFKVPMRQAPTVTVTSTGTTSRLSSLNVSTTGIDAVSFQAVSSTNGMVYVYGSTAANASAEL